jgi:nucleotidyltransferase substrate binding protein (TIGR01987 family)
MLLELDSLKKAVAALNGVLAKSDDAEFMRGLDEIARSAIKSGVIQHFEFTYELSHKMLKRYLEMTAPNPVAIDEMTFPDLIRTGSEQGLLLNGWDVWKYYRKARGTTSHAYGEEKAAEVLAAIPGFLREAQYLLAELEKRNREAD